MDEHDKLQPIPLDEPETDEEVRWLQEAERRGRRAEKRLRQLYRDEYGAPQLGDYHEQVDVETEGDDRRPVALTWRGQRYNVLRCARFHVVDLANLDAETASNRSLVRVSALPPQGGWGWELVADLAHDPATDTWTLVHLIDELGIEICHPPLDESGA